MNNTIPSVSVNYAANGSSTKSNDENGGAKVCHGSGGMSLLRAA